MGLAQGPWCHPCTVSRIRSRLIVFRFLGVVRVETYILMGVCLVCFLGTIGIFRLLIADPDQAMLIGAAAGLLIAIAAGGGYYTWLASCRTCI